MPVRPYSLSEKRFTAVECSCLLEPVIRKPFSNSSLSASTVVYITFFVPLHSFATWVLLHFPLVFSYAVCIGRNLSHCFSQLLPASLHSKYRPSSTVQMALASAHLSCFLVEQQSSSCSGQAVICAWCAVIVSSVPIDCTSLFIATT